MVGGLTQRSSAVRSQRLARPAAGAAALPPCLAVAALDAARLGRARPRRPWRRTAPSTGRSGRRPGSRSGGGGRGGLGQPDGAPCCRRIARQVARRWRPAERRRSRRGARGAAGHDRGRAGRRPCAQGTGWVEACHGARSAERFDRSPVARLLSCVEAVGRSGWSRWIIASRSVWSVDPLEQSEARCSSDPNKGVRPDLPPSIDRGRERGCGQVGLVGGRGRNP